MDVLNCPLIVQRTMKGIRSHWLLLLEKAAAAWAQFSKCCHTQFLLLIVSGPVISGAVMLLQSAVSVLEIGTNIASFPFQTAHFPETKALRL